MKPLNSPLYWRVLLWFCAANLLVLLLGGLLAQRYLAYTSGAELNWATLAQNADLAYETGGAAALANWVARRRQHHIDATLFEHGQPLYPIRLPPKLHARLPKWLASGKDTVKQPRPGLYVIVQQVTGSDGHARQLLALSHSHLHQHAREGVFLVIQLLLSLLFIGFVGWWVARSVARPVAALRRATRRMAKGELSARIGRQSRLAHDELARLASDFDTMAERIEALVAHDRGVLQDLSHELRSPLARLHLLIDLAQRGQTSAEAAPYFEQAEQEIVQLDRMLGETLALSRLEHGLPGMERETLDLAKVVRTCVDRARLEATARQIGLHMASPASIMISGVASLLGRAVDNLIENAIKFSPQGSCVEVTLREDPPCTELTVRDYGPGVPAGELPQLFRPFFRGSNARLASGHGLGLAIVQRVVQVHAGAVDVRNADDGGLVIRLRLPVASSFCATAPARGPCKPSVGI